MTDPFDEYGEILRRALHAEADSVMPAPDGLERIRERINDPRHHRVSAGGQGRSRRLGWAWFGQSWARPLLAVGAATFVAVLAVSAPPAIHGMTSAGDRGPAAHDSPRHDSPAGGAQSGRQNPTYPDPQPTPHPSAVVTPTPSPVLGTPSCEASSSAVKASKPPLATPSTAPVPPVSSSPVCPEPPVTPTPTPAPPSPETSQPETPSAPPQSEVPPPQSPS
jgi:hypothetical protein